jgi:hypothetical protein
VARNRSCLRGNAVVERAWTGVGSGSFAAADYALGEGEVLVEPPAGEQPAPALLPPSAGGAGVGRECAGRGRRNRNWMGGLHLAGGTVASQGKREVFPLEPGEEQRL